MAKSSNKPRPRIPQSRNISPKRNKMPNPWGRMPQPITQQQIREITRLREIHDKIRFELEWVTLKAEDMLRKGSPVQPGKHTAGLFHDRLHIWEDTDFPDGYENAETGIFD